MSNDINDMILDSAEDIEIPDSISPDRIAERLKEQDEATSENLTRMEDELEERKHASVMSKSIMGVAAAIALFITLGALFKFGYDRLNPARSGDEVTVALDGDKGGVKSSDNGDDYDVTEPSYDADEEDDYEEISAMLHPASSYEEIEQGFIAFYDKSRTYDMGNIVSDLGAAEETIKNYSVANGISEAHSDTNIRTDGVDEADVVKTDGKYIYICRRSIGRIEIVSCDGGKTAAVAKFDPGFDGRNTELSEIYLSGDTLVVVGNVYDTQLRNEGNAEDVYVVGMRGQTAVWIYNISDRRYPSLINRLLMDGSYYSSRLIGGENGGLYLFTNYNVGGGYEGTTYTEDDSAGGFKAMNVTLPTVDEMTVEPDMILIPDEIRTRSAFCMAAIDLESEGAVTDYKVIMGYTNDIYVSEDAVYLLGNEYTDDMNTTNVVRFAFSRNHKRFLARGAANVPGDIRDDFAIDEADGFLRVAVTVDRYANGELARSNELFVYDETMKKVGSLTGMAAGEEIKSARYIGDYLYLVTYKNTDPLFAIDLSEPTEPKVAGELKLNGFSEYLHPWDNDTLIGLGVDSDERGVRKGLKLSLFDISDPLSVTESETKKISADDSSAFWDYRAFGVYERDDYIGFVTETYGTYKNGRFTGDKVSYNVYRVADDGITLVKQIEIPADSDGYVWNVSAIRGVFIGDYLYLVTEDGVEGYMLLQ